MRSEGYGTGPMCVCVCLCVCPAGLISGLVLVDIQLKALGA